MKRFKRILCPVDFSDFSRHALIQAQQLARRFEAELKVLHVVNTRFMSLGNLVAVPDVYSESRKRAEREFAVFERDLKIGQKDMEILEGAPHDVIVSKSREASMDLLVMGTHGLSGFERLFLGSVTEKVLHKSEIPLWIVTRDTPVTPEQGYNTILAAFDLGPGSEALASDAIALAEHFGSELLAVHVISTPQLTVSETGAPWLSEAEWLRLVDRMKADQEKRLTKLIPDPLRTGAKIERIVRQGRPSSELLDVARERNAQLLLLGAYQHTKGELDWIGSTCHRVIRMASCPVLVLKGARTG